MIRRTTDLSAAARARFDAIIDVRSPCEFAHDHIPGAINLPVLDDVERAEIGTIYVQRSKFLARRLGAAKVARNIAIHLDDALADRDGSFRPLVHCWRGGQRSGAMAAVMDQIGWPVTVLDGGYMTWRRRVQATLYGPAAWAVVLIDGGTGSGKTALLERLAARGVQTLDLEGLAEHRGSLFGALKDRPQPSQKLFESRLFTALEGLDPTRPVVVEAESSRIGARTVPPALWAAMGAASVIELSAPVEARAAFSALSYADIASDAEALEAALSRLPPHHSKETVAAWKALARAGQTQSLASALIADHYDPAYRRQSAHRARPLLGRVEMAGLSDADLDRAAEAIAGLIKVD
ncbi:tRNA 2-selenouridine(34) synthase MnmH [Brevundimonas aurifodinae]|uniref:tRNA 2-selenouridine(34) synthase MnmH n=2 Tax=Brevundimonas TaxID=41275 RepID=A0ABV1NJM2_9CAUL|nr:MAG: tRNA 2-selenouridine(34) synthase MnmH [Brevundimonas sp. 12-68-7]OYX30857.1 MAG: tRNA 2-selenouridine(34) synthase MnmH [Brevundimonas subvibrioides]